MDGASVVNRDQWLVGRLELLDAEKAHQRERDALAARRRSLPMVRVDEEYRFDTEGGVQGLGGLFQGCGQLIVYHFMFGSTWEEGCPSCSFWTDSVEGTLPHLRARDTNYVNVSTAPLDALLRYRQRMGWTVPWVSSGGTTFQADFGAAGADTYNYRPSTRPNGEVPGLSVFVRRGDEVFHSYSTFARGLEPFNAAYALLDVTPAGRNEDDLDFPMAWVRRHDRY